MKNIIEIPRRIQFRIYLSLILTLILFVSVYFALFFIGGFISVWFEVPEFYKPMGVCLVILGIIPLIYAILVKSREEGFEAKEKEFPELYGLVREIAEELNVAMPSKILILPTEEIYVMGVFHKNMGIGMAALRAISKEELKSILRHEFGHFYGNDTIVGAGLSKIQISLEGSSNFGKSWWNAIPLMEIAIIGLFIVGFAKLYSFIFRVIISVYSRQVEYRADYIASKLDNKKTFGPAILNYSAYSIYFGRIGYNSIIHLLQQGKAFVNIYETICNTYEKEDPNTLKEMTFKLDKSNIFSSHPKLISRLKQLDINLDSLKIQNKLKYGAISLISKSKQHEEEFTKLLTSRMHINLLYADAVARQGKCKYCGEQFEQLQYLLQHEAECRKKNIN